MNAGLLLDHFDRISEAPDAISRLRSFVLDLAVRGKLAEQNPNDEPASALLRRIQTEKAEITLDRGIWKEKPLSLQAERELPFCIPSNWRWSQLAEMGFINPRNIASDETPSSFVPMTLISSEYAVASTHQVRLWGEIKSGFTHFAEGDVALAKITPCFENGKSTIFRTLTGGIGAGTTELHVVRPVIVSAEYVLIFLKCPHFIKCGITRMTGTAGQKRVPKEYFANSPFPLPPLAEQIRIVAKVEELMSLCDRLGAAQRDREDRRERLIASSHHQLNNGACAKDLQTNVRFYLNHLPRLITTSKQISALRQTILDLAVRGRLTQGDNFSRKQTTGGSIATDTGFPAHWSVQRLTGVADSIVDCPHSTPKWTTQGKLCVRTNQFRPGRLDLSDVRFVSESTYQERIQRLEPTENDILYSREGGILGIACRVPPSTQLCLGQRMMLIRPGPEIDATFLEMILNSPLITRIAAAKTTGGAAPRINVATVKAYPIPLPPIAEQHCIVAKVDELMSLCDRIEAQIAAAQIGRRSLLEAVLFNVLTNSQPATYESSSVLA